jgi:hypothetical protein
MKKANSLLQLKKSIISNLKIASVSGGRVTTDQDTMKHCDSTSGSGGSATISYSNCGDCGGW